MTAPGRRALAARTAAATLAASTTAGTMTAASALTALATRVRGPFCRHAWLPDTMPKGEVVSGIYTSALARCRRMPGPHVCAHSHGLRHVGSFAPLGHKCLGALTPCFRQHYKHTVHWCTHAAHVHACVRSCPGDGVGSGGDAWWAAAADEEELVDAPRRVERLDVTYARASKQARRRCCRQLPHAQSRRVAACGTVCATGMFWRSTWVPTKTCALAFHKQATD